MLSFNTKNRTMVLEYALIVENMTSLFLAQLLGIEDYKNSRVLGNKSGCLSFNTKVDLLIELGALSKQDRKKFQAFMEIRNQFMHNMSASTFSECFSYLNGTDKFVLNTYGSSSLEDLELQLESATKKLCEDVAKLTAKIIDKVKEQNTKRVHSITMEESHNAFIKTFEQYKTSIEEFIENAEKNSKSYSQKSLFKLLSDSPKLFFLLYKKNFLK